MPDVDITRTASAIYQQFASGTQSQLDWWGCWPACLAMLRNYPGGSAGVDANSIARIRTELGLSESEGMSDERKVELARQYRFHILRLWAADRGESDTPDGRKCAAIHNALISSGNWQGRERGPLILTVRPFAGAEWTHAVLCCGIAGDWVTAHEGDAPRSEYWGLGRYTGPGRRMRPNSVRLRIIDPWPDNANWVQDTTNRMPISDPGRNRVRELCYDSSGRGTAAFGSNGRYFRLEQILYHDIRVPIHAAPGRVVTNVVTDSDPNLD